MTYWHTTYGAIQVKDVVLWDGKRSIRPFPERAAIQLRGCSLPLQRRIVDFGSDVPFQAIPEKLREHYSLELCMEVVRHIVLTHAEKMGSFEGEETELPTGGAKQLVTGADGSMVPIVQVSNDPSVKDKRKTRRVAWQEARLCFARDVTQLSAHFGATMGSTEQTGDLWYQCALAAGMGIKTKVHAVCDGASWIREQADRVFAKQGRFLIDFFHLSEYLGGAASTFEASEPKQWLKEQQDRLKRGDLYLVLQALESHLNQDKQPEEPSVRACYRYMTNRLDQMDYLDAIENDLPIGSGEIESGHRHVIQKRMKRAGMWWKKENAESMLQLLTLRANSQWVDYWKRYPDQALREAA